MSNRVIHFEIHATDTARAAAFYAFVFGWDVRKWDMPGLDYYLVQTAAEGSTEPGINGGIVARRGPAPTEGQPVAAFVCTIHVPSVDAYVTKILAAGGSVAAPKAPVPGLAWLTYCKDSDGNIFGIYEEDPKAA